MLTKRMPFELSEYRQRLEKCQEMMISSTPGIF